MSSYLQTKLAEIDRTHVVDDTVRLIDQEVSNKKGIAGMAIKAGYAAVKKLKNGQMIQRAVDHLLDEFTQALGPLHEDYRTSDQAAAGFGAYLSAHPEQANNALLSITDAKAERAESKVVKSTYQKLRGQAEKHVTDALPGVGEMIDKHVPVQPS